MQKNSQAIATSARTRVVVLNETRRAALVALIFGVALVYTVGFANSQTVHDAAHDTRHALSFPCH
jgi:cobalt transporter subunit CbtB